jgi:RNA polymerase sigma-70 factor, ECF subfamily
METDRKIEPAPVSGARGSWPEDTALVQRILAGDETAFELLMRRHNQLLFRTARAVVRNADEAEDVVQEAYLKAYCALDRFEGRSRLTTWLVRITMNEALSRAVRAKRVVPLPGIAAVDDAADDDSTGSSAWHGETRRQPEEAAGDSELRTVLTDAVDRLPESLRAVFMLRAVEQLSVEETAECLDLSAEAVRVRFHRARAALRDDIDCSVTEESRRLFSFGNERCDRVVEQTLVRIRGLAS